MTANPEHHAWNRLRRRHERRYRSAPRPAREIAIDVAARRARPGD